MYERRRFLVAMSFAVMFGLLLFAALDGRAEATRAAQLAKENAGLRGELLDTQKALETAIEKLDVLSLRIDVLEQEIRRLGGDPTTVVIEGTSGPTTTTPPTSAPRRPPSPRPTTTTTTTTTQPDPGLCVLVVCIGGTPWPSTVNPRSSSAPSTRSSRSPSASASTSPPNKSVSSTPR